MAKIVNDIIDLTNLLKEVLGDRVKETEYFDPFHSRMLLEVDGKNIAVLFTPHKSCTLVAAPGKGRESIEAIKPYISQALDFNGPLCCYTLTNDDDENEKFSMEWEIKDPVKRLKEIQSGTGFTDGLNAKDLEVLNGLKAEECVETEEEKKERLANLRIPGIDPGHLDPAEVARFSEADLFCAINNVESSLNFYRPLFKLGMPGAGEVVVNEQFSLDYLIYQTTRFGVSIPEPQINKRIVRTPEYEAWHDFWHNHFFNELNERQRTKYNKRRAKGKNISKYLPNGTWRDTYEKPIERKMTPREE